MIGATIKSRRKELGITQPELANLADISVNTLYKIEREQGNPTLKVLEKVSNIIGMELVLRIKPTLGISSMRHPRFTIYHDQHKGYQYRLTAKNESVILKSEYYSSESDLQKVISMVKEIGFNDDHYDRKSTENNQFYYILRAPNDDLMGSSEMYQTPLARDNGIESVKAYSAEAAVEMIVDS